MERVRTTTSSLHAQSNMTDDDETERNQQQHTARRDPATRQQTPARRSSRRGTPNNRGLLSNRDDDDNDHGLDSVGDYFADDPRSRSSTQQLPENSNHNFDAEAGERIVRSIASFLSFSDAVSIGSAASAGGGYLDESFTNQDWAVGTSMEPSPRWSTRSSVGGSRSGGSVAGLSRIAADTLMTPPTPALVAISPNPDFEYDEGYGDGRRNHRYDRMGSDEYDDYDFDDESFQQERRRQWAKQKLAAAVFSHPASLRSFCRDAYQAAKAVQNQIALENTTCTPQGLNNRLNNSFQSAIMDESPETLVEPRRQHPMDDKVRFIITILGHVFDNVPLSVVLDVLGGLREVTLDSSFATVRITNMTVTGIVNACIRVVVMVWDGITHFNPLDFAHMIITRPFNMMGKTTEVVVSGIQSVATGVGSASSIALHRLSAKNTSTSSLLGSQGNLRRMRSPPGKAMSKKLLKKLSSLNSAASVISYTELDDNTGGLSKHAKSRVQRMMHYDVSLRPFVATIKLQETFKRDLSTVHDSEGRLVEETSSSSSPSNESPFMCTPQSFPPTPASRKMVLARGTRFSDDVIFLARDQLRVHDGLQSTNERTKEMAEALKGGKRLAVFDADDASAGIDLTCGQHVATKIGNLLYCSTRSMIPILRNCFVYYEMTVLPRAGGGGLISQTSMATLSLGLSTKEMPPNTLVGAWKGSVGLCTTGQILVAGQWYSPDPSMSSFGDRATVGCLVCLDDSSAFETWDGLMVTATVTFNIDGQIVRPPVPSLPVSGADQNPSSTPTSSHSSTSGPAAMGAAPPSFTLPLLVPSEEELYPTLTLHSPGTSVMCRFSAGDVVAKSRESIGAPSKVPIYSCDGSLVL